MILLKTVADRRSTEVVDCGAHFRVNFHDRFVKDNIIPITLSIRGHHRFSEIKGVLWDLRTADLSELTLEQLVDVFKSQHATSGREPLRVALVIESVYDVCIIKLWEHVGEDSTPNIRRWFTDETKALEWITE